LQAWKKDCIHLYNKMMMFARTFKFKYQNKEQEFKISRSNLHQYSFNTNNTFQTWAAKFNLQVKPSFENLSINRKLRVNTINKRKNIIILLTPRIRRSVIWWSWWKTWKECMKMSWKYKEHKKCKSNLNWIMHMIKLRGWRIIWRTSYAKRKRRWVL
jgi:hypothetical protein